ncbi:aminopeptidase N [Suncus etruscus]|uniref:aminopeptidase N n=1 Tax=Suncus etruscus TaxID=109475 RepID=UPI00210FEAF8|nr:aminopeptidase N [Suncus etruscus]
MAKGFFISKTVGILGIILGLAAVSTIIALSVVYSQEKNKNNAESNTVPPTNVPPTAATTPDPNLPWNKYRLPDSLFPHSYSVQLRPFLTPNNQGLYVFEGSSTARFVCLKATDKVIIHSKKLNYTTAPVLRSVDGAQAPAIERWQLVELTEYLVLHLKESLQQGKTYDLDTKFVGELADDLAGFYRSEYMDNGVKKVVATTQMQAADARKSFPCFDEPAMKAIFNISLIYPKEYHALSNMPPKGPDTEYSKDPNWRVIEFQTTPKMSTYLLAYIVSQFDSEKAETANKVQIKIWARPSAVQAGHAQYALKVTGPILDFFARHYNTAYPLSKSDQIGLPDFNAGAMENWGLVTYRENSLLFDPYSSSIGNKERVVTVIAHELAHQWFGNLVTVAWWNDLWLNEGFASYVEYLGAHHAEPDWNLQDLMVLNEVYRVMAVDALASSHPLSTPANEVNTPAQISELFDAISYSKGASVLRMLSTFLTEDLFKEGLASYLHAFSYNNTVYQDLWNHLQKAVDNRKYPLPTSVSNIMDRWILQMGFPVVTVDTTNGTISQKHFLLDPESNVTRPSPFKYLWIIPISWMKAGAEQESFWLNGTEREQNNSLQTNANEWLLLNLNVTGYFRVNYDEGNWKKLQNQLQNDLSVIPSINRAQIIHDAFTLSSAGMVGVTLALDNTLFLSKEVEYMPWQAALDSLSYFKLMFDRTKEVYDPMKNYLKKQVTPLFNHFKTVTKDWSQRPTTLMDQYNEVNAISTACSSGLQECQTLVQNLYRTWMQDPTNNTIIHPNLRSAVYCNAISLGGAAEWNFAWEQFRNATVVNEADKLRAALACSTNVDILQRYLEYALDPNFIRKQDATSTITSIASNPLGQTLAWTFVKYNWKKLFEDYGGGSFSFANLIQAVTRRFNTEDDLKQLEQFKKDNMDTGFGSGTRALEQALEKTKANIKWVAANKKLIQDWFNQNQ